MGNSYGEEAFALQHELLSNDELAQALKALYETHATKGKDRLDIDRFIKAQSILHRVVGDKPERENLAGVFLELSRGTSGGETACAVFSDWQLKVLLGKGMQWRQIVRVVTQAIAEILQEHVDDPGTVSMNARFQQRQAGHYARRRILTETVGRQLRDESKREADWVHSQMERERRESMLKEMSRDGQRYQRKRDLAFTKVQAESTTLKRLTSAY